MGLFNQTVGAAVTAVALCSGGALWAALRISAETENATIVTIVCDRGDRYLSTGIFPAE